MIIGVDAYTALIDHLRQAVPDEGCGLLAGLGPAGPCPRDTDGDGGCGRRHCPHCGQEATGRTCDTWVPMDNVAEFPRLRFEMDPQALLDAWKTLDGAGRRPWIVAHSHPRGDAVPSTHDKRYATDPTLQHLVVSLAGRAPHARLWHMHPAEYVAANVRYRVVDLGRKENPPTDLTRGVSGD